MEKHIVSASIRTDIPAYYREWFRARLKAGFAEARTTRGVKSRVSLLPEDVLGYLFWTKNAARFHETLRSLRDGGMPYVFHYTITGYGSRIEKGVLSRDRAIADFLKVREDLPGSACIMWRYDPIILCDAHDRGWHLMNFRMIAEELRGATKIVNIKFIEPNLRTVRRMEDPSVLYRTSPRSHPTVEKMNPPIKHLSRTAGDRLLANFRAIASENGMALRVCCNNEYDNDQSQCCGPEIFAPYGSQIADYVATIKPGPSRSTCQCVKTYDIGMDNTCPAGCLYCYVVSSQKLALSNTKAHNPAASMLRSPAKLKEQV